MQKAFEKIIERLEEYKDSLIGHNSEESLHCKSMGDCEGVDCNICIWDKAIEIANQVAKEYLPDTNVGNIGEIRSPRGHYGCNTNGEHEKCFSCGVADNCPDYKKEWFEYREKEDVPEINVGNKKQTNADKIRTMTDEELAEMLLNSITFEKGISNEPYRSIWLNEEDNEMYDSYGDILEFLRKE